MDDSCKHGSGLSICTESYSEQEVLLLIYVLKEKFNIDSNPMKRNSNKFRIYIKSKSLNDLRKLVSPYFIPSMMYKIS
jgi:LAGLIDADG DNA endonuclease family